MSDKYLELVANPLLWVSILVSVAPLLAYYFFNSASPPSYEQKKREYYSFVSKGLLSDVKCDRCKTIIGKVCGELEGSEKIRCINALKKLSVERNWEKELEKLPEEQKNVFIEKVKEDLEKLSKERGIKLE
jgi:hypothetical protein